MTENKYTDGQIIEALQVRMPHDAICREAYDIIHRQAMEIARQKEVLDKLFENNERIKQIADQLKDDIAMELNKTRQNAITEFAQEIIYGVLTQFNGVDIKVSLAIAEKARKLRSKEISLL